MPTDPNYAALDLLATMVAVVTPEGECIFANSSFENVLGLSRRSMSRSSAFDWFADARVLQGTVAAVSNNAFATSRLDAHLKRYEADEAAAKQATSHGESKPKPDLDPSELAAYTLVANMILNLDETVTRN